MTANARKTAKRLGPVAEADYFERKYDELRAALRNRIGAANEQILATRQRAEEARANGHDSLHQLCRDEAIGMEAVLRFFETLLKIWGDEA